MGLSESAKTLRDLFDRVVLRRVEDWTDSSNPVAGVSPPKTSEMSKANIATSLIKGSVLRHVLVLDIDHPAWLVKSSTPGHFHLYVDVPGGIADGDYWPLLEKLSNAGVIEEGYYQASRSRGYSSVRLPWVKKGDNDPQDPQLLDLAEKIQAARESAQAVTSNPDPTFRQVFETFETLAEKERLERVRSEYRTRIEQEGQSHG